MSGLLISYRDELGGIISTVDERYGISFCDGKVYFTSGNGVDHEIDIEMLHSIGIGEI